MRKTLERSVKYGELLDMVYMAGDGKISRRRVRVLQVGESSFRAYCLLRGSKRTFAIDNALALVPVINHGRAVI